MGFTFTKEELIQYIAEEIRGVPCFQCIDGFLQMEAISFNDLVEVGVFIVLDVRTRIILNLIRISEW